MDKADLIVNARWIVPVEPAGTVLDYHALVVRDGRISDVLPQQEAADKFDASLQIDRPGHLLMPGFVNAHTHAAMTLLRGLADDMPLSEWLEQHIWPAEMRWAGQEFVRDGTELAILEMIRGGTTCFQDMYYFPDVVGQVALERNIRAVVGMIMIEQPTTWAQTTEEYFSKGLAVHDRFRGNSLIRTAFAPHAPYSVGDDTLERIRMLADQLEITIHTHVHETAGEIQDSIDEHGRRPLTRLNDLGLVTSMLNATHLTQVTDDEIDLLAERGVSVIHCPESNLKLASGFCPVAKLLAAGVNVALGTDGASSNNDLDMVGEMRMAALLGKGVSGDPAALSAEQVLTMATLNGARALGLASVTGSLETGKFADMICVDLGTPASQPVYSPVSQLVYTASRDQVTDTWVAGQPLMLDRQLTTDCEQEVLERAGAWQRRLAEDDA